MGLEATAAAASLSTSISCLCAYTHTHTPKHTQTNTERHKLAEMQISSEKMQPPLQTDDFMHPSSRRRNKPSSRWPMVRSADLEFVCPVTSAEEEKTNTWRKKKTPNVPHKGRVSFAANI